MIQTGMWQEPVIRELTLMLEADSSVLALILTGSCAQPQSHLDPWSDVDVFLVIADEAIARYYPGTDWLAPLGELFATDRSAHAYWSTLRVCFTDLRRIDFGITTESAFQHIGTWDRNPLAAGFRLLFSHSTVVTAELEQKPTSPAPSEFTPEQFQVLTNQFWFKGTLAVTKLMRNDLLIGLHLALDMVRDCLVLAMVLRDRAAGTNHHRWGGAYNEAIERLDFAHHAYTALGILDLIEQSGIIFDQLAGEWSESLRAQRQPLIEWIAYARQRSS